MLDKETDDCGITAFGSTGKNVTVVFVFVIYVYWCFEKAGSGWDGFGCYCPVERSAL